MDSNHFTGSLPEHLLRCHPHWQALFRQAQIQPVLQKINNSLSQRLQENALIYPAYPLRVFEALAPADIKVVILGQDPYHGPGQAQGLAFSVPDHIKTPPSLRNIFKELGREYGDQVKCERNSLEPWLEQGVLLLNTALTVENGKPASHAKLGWESVTNIAIQHIANQEHCVFLLWGAHAQSKIPLIEAGQGRHLILKSNHPSPLSASRPPVPFLGNGHFKATNDWLTAHGLQAIDWSLIQQKTQEKQQFSLDFK